MRECLLMGLLMVLSGCGQDTVETLLDENPGYAGKPDEHGISTKERREVLRQRLLKVQTDR